MYIHTQAAQLVFTRQPSLRVMVAVMFPRQPVVAIQDAFGNVLVDALASVKLMLEEAAGVVGSSYIDGSLDSVALGGYSSFSSVYIKIVGHLRLVAQCLDHLIGSTCSDRVPYSYSDICRCCRYL